jgi:ubiquinone/menaquinone biosynthesis C-methylase UbiE
MKLHAEVERIRQMYAERDANPLIQQMWAPFADDEVNHRNQQYWCLANLLRSVGRSSLAGLRILDVGCGEGRLLRACIDMGASPESLSGVDVRSNAIDEARRLSPQLDFSVGNGIDLDFSDGQFDLVMQFVAFSSVFQDKLRRHLASEMARVLKQGGYIFWWDLLKTVRKDAPETLQPRELFPGMSYRELRAGSRPKPSTCVRLPRPLKALGWFVDGFSYPQTHIAAVIGPNS